MLNGFSAHADRGELCDWLTRLQTPPRRVFVVHGEEDAATAFGDYLTEKTGWNVLVPQYQQIVDLD